MTLGKALEIAYVAYQRYDVIEDVTPSGKRQWQCNVCEHIDAAPCKYPYHNCFGDFLDLVLVYTRLGKD